MPEVQGVLNLCLPAVVLNAILRKLIAEGDRPRRRSKDAVARMRELMGQSRLGVTLQLPPIRLRASEVATLEPGTVLRLPVPRHESSEIRIGGLWLAKACPVRSGDHRGALLEGASNGLVAAPRAQSASELRVN
jgi:flagellar motor switch protein FliM